MTSIILFAISFGDEILMSNRIHVTDQLLLGDPLRNRAKVCDLVHFGREGIALVRISFAIFEVKMGHCILRSLNLVVHPLSFASSMYVCTRS